MVREKYRKAERENFTTVRIPRTLHKELSKYKEATGINLPAAMEQALLISTMIELEGYRLISPEDYAEFEANNHWKGKYLMAGIHRDHMAHLLGNVVAAIGTQLAQLRAAVKGVELDKPTDEAVKVESDQIRQEIEKYVADNTPDTE